MTMDITKSVAFTGHRSERILQVGMLHLYLDIVSQVTGVSSGKMSDAGVRKGFIILKANDQPMRKVSDLEEVMKAAVKSPNQVLFLTGVFPSGKRGYFAVDLTQE